MLGLAVLLFIGLFLLITFIVMGLAARWARKRGRRRWVWGGIAALAMYHLMFWDLIPTLLIHRYYCATEAGFWIYKTPEEWVEENPGVLETLSKSHLPEEYKVKSEMKRYGGNEEYLLPDGTRLSARYGYDHRTKAIVLDHISVYTPDGWRGTQLNERLRSLWQTTEDYPFSINRTEHKLIDFHKESVLVRRVNFGWGQGNALSLGPSGPIRALGTAYLAGGGGCGIADYLSFRKQVDFFRNKERFPYKGD